MRIEIYCNYCKDFTKPNVKNNCSKCRRTFEFIKQ